MAIDNNERPLILKPDRPLPPASKEVFKDVVANDVVESDERFRIATLRLEGDQREVLEAPIPVEDLDILPTGEVYASQIQYRRRLTKVFGPGGWAMVERGQPKLENNVVIQKWGLYAQGVLISTAWGEQEYFPANSRMSYATALESAKSNALMRCCKDLAIASECWDRHFTEVFKQEHCVEVLVPQYSGSPRKQWRRKNSPPFPNERKVGAADEQPRTSTPKKTPTPTPPPAEKINPDLAADLTKLIADSGSSAQEILNYCRVETLEDISKAQYEAVVATLRKRLENSQKS